MSNVIETKKILVTRECIVGKKCDICGKEIPPTKIPHSYGEPVYDYYEVTTHHGDWGNDSVESYEHFDACSPDCADKLWKEYIRDSAGKRNTKCIEVEHINCWSPNYEEAHEDALKEPESSPKGCTYYEAKNRKPCCTHECDGCVWYV